MSEEWQGAEMEFDELPSRGIQRIPQENIRYLDEGVEIEMDCASCQDTTSVEIPWAEVVRLAAGLNVPNVQWVPQRHNFVAQAICTECVHKYEEAGIDVGRAKKAAQMLVEISPSADIVSWFNRGRTAGKIPPKAVAWVNAKRAQRANPQPQQPQQRPQNQLAPQARRRQR